MDRDIEFTEEAEAEMQASYDWYENQGLGLGDRFINAVSNCLEKIDKYPDAFRIVYKKQRQAGIIGFPFVLMFEVYDQRILVYAVFHTRRNPNKKYR